MITVSNIEEKEGLSPVAKQVRDELIRQKVSIAQLSIQADVEPQTISDLINGKRNPRKKTLEKILEALGI